MCLLTDWQQTGCNVLSRTFSDQAALLGPQMNGRLSDSIIYEWTQEENDYGLVTYSRALAGASTSTASTPIPFRTGFSLLKSRWATLNPDGTETT
jgi:hypothetical protein